MSSMLRPLALALSLALGTLSSAPVFSQGASSPTTEQAQGATQGGQGSPVSRLPWQHGPVEMSVGSRATLKLPERAAGLKEDASGEFLRMTGNIPSPGATIVTSGSWWAVFDYADEGYIKDDEKIDADALLKQLQASDGPANEERKRQGLKPLHTDGWFVPPHYDEQTKRLEWGIKLHEEGSTEPVVNYTVRVLGRRGYEAAVLVSDPQSLSKDVQEFKQILAQFDFVPGERYSEFRSGDRVAEYGIAALVAGGAAAVATKTGFWKVLLGFLAAGWKVVVAGVVALGAGIGKLFSRKRES